MTTFFRADDMDQNDETQPLDGTDNNKVVTDDDEDDLAPDAELGNEDSSS